MRILLDCQVPVLLAHGGVQIQIEKTKQALESQGLDVDYLRWWDTEQKGDIIHFFGRANPSLIRFAHGKNMKYVMSDLLTAQGSRSRPQLRTQAAVERILRAIVPSAFLATFRWDAYHEADAVVVLTEWEAEIVQMLFGPAPGKLHVVPNGVEEEFFLKDRTPPARGRELVCTATITERKRVLETARAAVLAKTPLRIVGAPYGPNDEYFKEFLRLSKTHPDLVRYDGPISDRHDLACIYQSSRGFVLLSTMESLSLSALEAAASGCPLLLSDLPWAHCTFGEKASYCPVAEARITAQALRSFYERADSLPKPALPCRWADVARQLASIYRRL
jgi:glycosyltransferase involved in cell wall biosynthesis